ncbi:uncharacterized protein TM35_000221800 [Trypanosoma theileri]|uniref:Uncharacterized protein n=1 Tax=Trypanosoma theileri TaxID=67003 RepID=A0A1X0NS05_9TRYP|nr:uncharacterized protein TM35_000221800 [Trypanosoma theileri]ORC87381.1 hypothetical protein TM35_000221800 [Trypanosoma theileri]
MDRNSLRRTSEKPFSPSNARINKHFMSGQPIRSTGISERKNDLGSLNKNTLRQFSRGSTPTHRQRTTSRSSGSCSVVTLEETIADVMGIRMQSLADLGARIEELSALHRQEEEAFRNQVGGVLQQLEVARVTHMDVEHDYEALLKKERAERQAVMSLMQQFKNQGAELINTMKKSLQEAREKWKAEVERNAHLAAQLRHYSKENTSLDSFKGDNTIESVSDSKNKALYTKIETLTRLLEEEDAIIVELQQRNKSLEKKVAVLTQQRNRLLDLEAQHLETEEFNTEYNNLLNQVRRSESNENEMTLEEKVNVLTRFTKMLLQRLQAEQRQRLRVEEQTVRMASEHDQLVRVLESRIKSVEGNKSVQVNSYYQNELYNGREENSDSVLRDEVNISLVNNSTIVEEENQTTEKERVGKEPECDNNGYTISPNSITKNNNILHPDQNKTNKSTGDSVHAVLEAQLTSLTSEFQQSISQWNTLTTNAGKGLREKDFYPD